MTGPVFVDTNVFICARQASAAEKQRTASGWLDELWQEMRGRTSMQVLNEYYVNLTRRIRPALPADEAWDDIRSLLSWNPQVVDGDLLLRAREIERRYRLSWWDSLIVAAAQAQNCVLLLSEDLQDRAVFGGVTVRNPFKLGVSEAAGEYPAPPALPSRHRPRGRPRRASRAVA